MEDKSSCLVIQGHYKNEKGNVNGSIFIQILELASRKGPSGCLVVPALNRRVAALFLPWSSSSISVGSSSATSQLGGTWGVRDHRRQEKYVVWEGG